MYKRHTFITISNEGRKRIYAELLQQGILAEDCNSLLLPEKFVPDVMRYSWCKQFTPALGIVRRETNFSRKNNIAVGFSSWKRRDGNRLRMTGLVAYDEILDTASPYDVLEMFTKKTMNYQRTIASKVVIELINITESFGFSLGVLGSFAQEIVTGYFYVSEISDIDVVLSASILNEQIIILLYKWFNQMMQIEQRFAIRIDTELELTNGYGIALKELFSEGGSVLGKSLDDVQLLSKKEIFTDWDRLKAQLKP